MHLLQQKLRKSTTRWNNKKLQRGLISLVIIYQLGTVDLAYNKSRVMGLSTSNNKIRKLTEGTGLVRS